MSQALDNVTILLKGEHDLVTNGIHVISSDECGAPRRCGGLGDIVSGACAVMAHWAWNLNLEPTLGGTETASTSEAYPQDNALWATWCAAVLVKKSTTSAFSKHKRSMTAPDVLAEVGETFESMFPVDV